MSQKFKRSTGLYALSYGISSVLLMGSAGFIYYTVWQGIVIGHVLHIVLLALLLSSTFFLITALISSVKNFRTVPENKRLYFFKVGWLTCGIFGSLTLSLVSSSLIVSLTVP